MSRADKNFNSNVVDITKKQSAALAERLMEVCALYSLSKSLSVSLDTDDIFKESEGLIKQSLGVDDFSIMLLDSKREKLVIWKANGHTMDDARDVSFKLGEGVCGVVAETGKSILVEDVNKDSRFTFYKGKRINIGSFYSTPLKSSAGELIGVFNVHKPDPNSMSENDIVVFSATADHIAKALENSKLFNDMRQLAISDELTGLYSRRYFLDALEKELSKAKRRQSPLSLIMFDLDHFKYVNDRFGHLTGDKVLKRFGDILKANSRQGDIAARFGGEEFVLLLPDVSLDGGTAIAEKIREVVENDDSVKAENKASVRVTVSCGVTGYLESGAEGDKILSLADKRLFEAKRTGRNNVCPRIVATGDPVIKEKRSSHRQRVGLMADPRPINVKSLDIEIDGKWSLCAVSDISDTGFKGIIDTELSLGNLYKCRAIMESQSKCDVIIVETRLVRRSLVGNGKFSIGAEIVDNDSGWKEIMGFITSR